jgi:hypothetical protein
MDTASNPPLLTASDLGKLIGRSTKYIRIDAVERPETLPEIEPGCLKSRPLWHPDKVRAWLQAIADRHQAQRAEAFRLARAHGVKDPLPFKPIAIGAKYEGRLATTRLKDSKQ